MNYDSNKAKDGGFLSGFSTVIGSLKKDVPDVSDEINNLFQSVKKTDKFNNVLASFDTNKIKDVTFKEWVDNLDEVTKTSMTSGKALEEYKRHLTEIGKTTPILSKLGSVIKSVFGNLTSFAINAGVMFAVSKGIESVVNAWDNYSNKQENAIEKGSETLSKHQEKLKEFSNSSKVVQDVGERFEELRKGVSASGDNIGLTTDEFTEYHSIVSQLAEAMPQLVNGYDSLGNPIISATTNVRELTQALKEQQQALNQENINNAQDYIDAFNAKSSQLKLGNNQEIGFAQKQNILDAMVNQINRDASKGINTNFSDYMANSMLTDIDGWFGDINGTINTFFEEHPILNGIKNFFGKDLVSIDNSDYIANDKLSQDALRSSAKNAKILDSVKSSFDISNMTAEDLSNEMLNYNLGMKQVLEDAGIDLDEINAIAKEADKLQSKGKTKEAAEKYEDYQTALKNANEQIVQFRQQNMDEWNNAFDNTKPLLESLLYGDDNSVYTSALRDSTKNVISSIINGMDVNSAIESGLIESNGRITKDTFKTWANGLARNIRQSGVEDSLSQLFDIQTQSDNMGYKEYVDEANKLIDGISSKVPELSSDILKSTTGIGDSIDNLKQKRLDLMNDGLDESFLDSLSIEDTEIIWDLNADGVIKNAEQAKKAIEDYKTTLAESDPDQYYNAYTQALETQNQGSKYDTMLSGYENIKESYKKGLVGTDDFKSFAAWLSPTASDDANNFSENYPKFERYFNDSKKGVNNFLDDISGLVNESGQKFAELNKETGKWDFNVTDLNDLGQKLGMGAEAVGAMFGKLREYNIDNNIITSTSEGASRIGQLITDSINEKKRNNILKSTTSDTEQGYKTTAGDHTFGNQTSIDESDKKLRDYNENIKQTIDNTKQLIRQQNDSEEAQKKAAIAAAKTLDQYKKQAEESGLIDTANAIQEQIDQFQTDFNIPNIRAEIDFDIDTATQNVQSLFDSAWNKMSYGGDVTGNLNIIDEKIQQIASHEGDISALVSNFNDLAEASGSIWRMDDLGNKFNLQDKVAEVQTLSRECLNLAQSGKDTSSVLASMGAGIKTLASAGADISELVNLYNSFAALSGSEFRMEVTGEIVSVEEYTGETPTIPVKYEKPELPLNELGISESVKIPTEYEKPQALPLDSLGLSAPMKVQTELDTSNVDSYQPEEKDSTVEFDKNSIIPDSYVPKNPTATVIYTPDTSRLINTLPPLTRFVNYINIGGTGGSPKASGTMFSPAYTDGTAYNVINTKPISAYSSGKVTLPHDERALVNEEYINGHSESIVRDGKWFLIPGGAHFENLKRGDLIFNAKQTDELLKYGMTNSHARTYASGTVSNVRNLAATSLSVAYASGSDTDNSFDWIEIWIKRFEEEIDHLTSAMTDIVGNSWKEQNKYIDRMLKLNNEAIKKNREAVNVYMQKANAVGLSDAYKTAVQKGQIKVEDISDENLRKKIEEYQSYYEKRLELDRKYDELVVKNLEYALTRMENIMDDYDKSISKQDSYISMLSAKNDYDEALGKKPNVSNYNGMLATYNETISSLTEEYKLVQEEFNRLVKAGTIKAGTDEYNEWTEKLNGMQEALYNARTEAAKLAEELRSIRWNNWNDNQNILEQAADEIDDVLSMIEDLRNYDDNGNITENGVTKLGLYSIQLENTKKQIAQYDTAIANLDKELKAGLITQDKYNEELADYKDKQRDAQKASKDARDAILDLVKEGISAAIDAYSELIDKRKEALQDDRSFRDHSRKIAEYEKELADIQNQINSYSASGSREDLAKVKELEKQKADIQKEYSEYMEDYQTDKQLEALDKELEDFKEKQEDKITELETSLDAQEVAIRSALETVTDDYTEVYGVLGSLADIYGEKLTETLSKPWQDAKSAYEQYMNAVKGINEFSGSGTVTTDKYTVSKNSSGKTTIIDNATGQGKAGWTKIGNDWYYADSSGVAQGNQWVKSGGKWYHTDASGKMQTGWVKDKGKWYYLDESGAMVTGWKKVKNKWYYLNDDGSMATGWKKVGGEWYFMNDDGSMKSSEWVKHKDKWYYLQQGGAMAKNAYVKDEKKDLYYWVNKDGEWEPKWNTSTPDLKKYKLAYANGTMNSAPGWKWINEDGIELVRTASGDLLYTKGGDTVFTNPMTQNLAEFSKSPEAFIRDYLPKFELLNIPQKDIANNIIVESPQLIIQGNVDNSTLPKIEKMINEKINDFTKQLSNNTKLHGATSNANRIR